MTTDARLHRARCTCRSHPRSASSAPIHGLLGTVAAVSATAVVLAGDCANPMVHNPLLQLLPPEAPAVTAVQDGLWSDPATWGGTLPGPGDDVRIPVDRSVVYDIDDDGDGLGPDTTRFHFVRVDGTLAWATDTDTTMYVDTLLSSPSGVVLVGSTAAPIAAGVQAEIIIIADDPMPDLMQLSRGIVLHGPNEFVGSPKSAYAALAGDAFAGDALLTLDAAPSNWAVGDTLVLGGTWYDPDGSDADDSRFHDEVLTITAIDGATITIDNPHPAATGLRWDHVRPSGTHFDAGDLTIHVANLTRNLTVRSELDPASPDAPGPDTLSDLRRGHVMMMHTNDTITRYAALVDFGRLDKNAFIDDPVINVDGTPGVGANPRGRYAFHLHRNLPPNDVPIDVATCPPAEVIGSVVWGSPGWGFVHHDSHAVFVENVTFDVLGSAFVQEAGNEIGRWERNLSIKTTGDDDPDLTVEPFGDGYKRVTNFDFGFNGEAYWIQGASQVAFIDNIAVSAAGGGANIFSDVDGNSNRDRDVVPRAHLPAALQHIVTNDDQTIAVNRVPANTFRGFEVSNSDFGLITWNHMRNQGSNIGFTCPCDGNVHREYAVIDDFRFWNIYGQGIHFQYSSQIELRNGLVASVDLATPGVDDKPAVDLAINGNGRGFGIGMNGPTKRLVIDDVAVEGWALGVRTPLEGQINGGDDGDGTGSEGAQGLPDRRSVYRRLHLANNDDHLYRRQNGFSDPQTFANYLELHDCSFMDDVPNEPPVADFTVESLGPHGVVRLDGLAAMDPDTPSGSAPGSVAVNDPNDIVAYGWDLDGDGAPDAWGERIVLELPLDTTTSIGLRVWDHQGASHAITKGVTPEPGPYPELIVDGDFGTETFNGGSISSASTDAGWFEAWGTHVDGGLELTGQFSFAWVGQAVYDAKVRRGDLVLAYDYALREGHDDPNNSQVSRLQVRMWGIDSEFTAAYREYPIPAGAIPYEAELLYEEWFETPTDIVRIERPIDVGPDGFTYYMISFRGSGVDQSVLGDHAWVDDVTIAGATVLCAADLDADGDVDTTDLVTLLAAWGDLGGPADVDDDGVVGLIDLLTLLGDWGTCP